MTLDVDLWRRAEQVFSAALETSPGEREALIRKTCAGDEALQRAVRNLLASHDSAVFLDTPLLSTAVPVAAVSAAPGTVGPYRLLRLIGEGGMSVVFLAERVEGEFRQEVAVKLIRDGRVGPATLRRFRRERRILAGLQHPNVAKLLDGGTSADGLSYVVMEYIQGVPITRYCDARRLSVRERLLLFRTICSAVQHAHAHLVIHRDIKPTNILVTDDGVPKLLDFGIATELGPRQAGDTDELTSTRERALTPEYASPEQAAGAPLSTATDIYSLGVLLHELLVGCRPSGPPSQIDPPSAHLVSRGPAALESLAAAEVRRSRIRELRRRISGDLDNIVLRALRLEPAQRYPSVEQLSADIARHLDGRPVSARPPALLYRTRKFVRRHALAVALGAFAVIGGLVLAGVLVHEDARVRRERDAAFRESERAERERERALEVTRFLVESFEGADPYKAGRQDVTLRALLDRSAERLERSLDKDPESRATLLTTIGDVYTSLGFRDRARPALEEALALRERVHGAESREVAETLMVLGQLLYHGGDVPAAEAAWTRALAIQRGVFGDRHVQTAATQGFLGESLSIRGEFVAAEPLLRQALEVQRGRTGVRSLELGLALNRLALLVQRKGDLGEAERLHREAVEALRAGGETDHAVAASAIVDLALLLDEKGDRAGAEPLYLEGLAIQRRVYGERHREVGRVVNALTIFYRHKGDYVAAERHGREALELCRLVYHAAHPNCAKAALNLASVLTAKGAPGDGVRLAREAIVSLKRHVRPEDPSLAAGAYILGTSLLRAGRLREAEPILAEGLARQRQRTPDSWRVGGHLEMLADVLWARGRAAEALPLATEAVAILTRKLPAHHGETALARAVLADCLIALGRLDEARPLVQQSLASARIIQIEGGHVIRRALEAAARYEAAAGAPLPDPRR